MTDAAVAETKEAPKIETEASSLPPSPLSGADAGKHDAKPGATDAGEAGGGQAKAADAKPEVSAADAKPEVKPEAKPEEKKDAKPEEKPGEAKKDSAAESGEKKPAEAKPEEKKPEVKAEDKGDAKDGPAKEPQPSPVYETLKLPDGITLDTKSVAKFDELVGNAEVKARTDPHAAIAELRQNAVNMYVEEVSNLTKQIQKNQVDVWSRLVEQRVNELKADAQLGGNQLETSLGRAKYVLESLIPGFSKEDAGEWIKAADAGGVSHHRLTIKLLNKIYDVFAEGDYVGSDSLKTPANQKLSTEAGKRGWYDKVDGDGAKAPQASP